jgi:phosphoribosylformylglycinamidine synthase
VVTFPGSLDDRDAGRAVALAGAEPVRLWHADADLRGADAVVLPGGFSYGDYLRCGAIARFAPVMGPIVAGARDGLPVLGICNGLPGALRVAPAARRARPQRRAPVRLPDQRLRIEARTAWTAGYPAGQEVVIPIKNGEGGFVADERTLDELEARAGSWPATSAATPTARPATSPASPTPPATWSA